MEQHPVLHHVQHGHASSILAILDRHQREDCKGSMALSEETIKELKRITDRQHAFTEPIQPQHGEVKWID